MNTLDALRRYANYLVTTPGTGVSLTGGDCPLASESDGTRLDPKTLRKVLGTAKGKFSDAALLTLCRTIAFNIPFVISEYRRCFGNEYPVSDTDTSLRYRRDPVASQIAVDIIVRLAEHIAIIAVGKDNLPFTRNRLFTGRNDLLNELYRVLQSQQYATLSSAALKGMGGVGKTHAALEYAYRYHARYEKIFWVQADGEPILRQSLAELDRLLDIEIEPTVDDRIRSVCDWLSRHAEWLMVIDNAECQDDVARLHKYLNFSGNGAIIVTTRTQAPSRRFVPLEVDTFSPEEGALFLARRTGRYDTNSDLDPEAIALAKRLGGLALALEQAGAYMVQQNMGYKQYRILYERKAPVLLDRAVDTDYGRTAHRALSISYEALKTRDALAAQLLEELTLCPPERIPIQDLFDDYDEILLRDAVWTLRDYSLISWQDEDATASIHRVVQDVIQNLMA